MDNISSKEGHVDIDLEKGELGSSGGFIFGTIRMNKLHSDSEPVNGGLESCCNESIKGEGRVISTVISNSVDGLEKVKPKLVDSKPKTMSAKKPPRPPRGLSLDSADQKLIRELQELAKLKRARIERMKALKKSKEPKASSSKNHLFATLLTLLFGLVLLFQGISSRTNSAAKFEGSPISSGTAKGSMVPLQQPTVALTSNVNGPNYESQRPVERGSGFDTQEQVSKAVG